MELFSFLNKKKEPKCFWCGKESGELPFAKTIGGTEYRFCSEECRRNFRIQYNKKAKTRGCPTCLLKRTGIKR